MWYISILVEVSIRFYDKDKKLFTLPHCYVCVASWNVPARSYQESVGVIDTSLHTKLTALKLGERDSGEEEAAR